MSRAPESGRHGEACCHRRGGRPTENELDSFCAARKARSDRGSRPVRSFTAELTRSSSPALPAEGLDRAWMFFGGVVATLIPDNTKAIIKAPDALDATLVASFLDYAQARSIFVDPARIRSPTTVTMVSSRASCDRLCRRSSHGARCSASRQRTASRELRISRPHRFEEPAWLLAALASLNESPERRRLGMDRRHLRNTPSQNQDKSGHARRR